MTDEGVVAVHADDELMLFVRRRSTSINPLGGT